MARKIVLDVDTGIDDALALLLALRSPELEVLGVTCVAGNITLAHVVRNTLATLEIAESRVPVDVGARKPLMVPLRTATFFHGSNGIADLQLPQPSLVPVGEDAASFMVRVARERPGEVTIVAVGPLTNVALAVLLDPHFAQNVADFIIMGGALSHPGNATGAAEANFSNDPEAAAAVVASGAPVSLVDLGATSQVVLPPERLAEGAPSSEAGRFARDLLKFYSRACVAAGAPGAVLHDPLAVGLAALPDLATMVPVHLEIETAGAHTRGASVGTFSRVAPVVEQVGDRRDVVGLTPLQPNASVARAIDTPRFLDLFSDRLELTRR